MGLGGAVFASAHHSGHKKEIVAKDGGRVTVLLVKGMRFFGEYGCSGTHSRVNAVGADAFST